MNTKEALEPGQRQNAKTFKDLEGRVWHLRLDVNLAERIKETVGIDFLTLLNRDNQTLQRLATDLRGLVDTLWLMCGSQNQSVRVRGEERYEYRLLQPDEFAAGLDGDVLDNATTALLQAVVDFFPKAQRQTLQAVLDQSGQTVQQTSEKAVQMIQSDRVRNLMRKKIDDHLEQLLDRELKADHATGGNTFTS